jgi:hypothetical protein
MNDASEVTVLQEGNVKITKLEIIIGPKTFAMSDVISVRMTARGAPGGCLALVVFLLGLFLLFVSGLGGPAGEVQIFALILIVIAVVIVAIGKPVFIVQIKTVSGKSNVLASQDRAYIKRVIDAMNEAIVLSGRSPGEPR